MGKEGKRMYKYKGVLLIGLILFMLTGCWDKVEIDKRAFVTAIGIDKFDAKAEEKKTEDKKNELKGSPRNRYIVTFEYPNTGKLAKKGDEKPDFLKTSVGQNFFTIDRSINTRMENTLFLRQTKVIIIGEALARDEQMMREVLDTIERSPEIGRKVQVMITPKKEKSVLKVSPKSQPVIGLFIRNLMEHSSLSSRTADADIGYIFRSLHESRAAVAPRIISSDDEIKVAGSAVLKGFKQIGWLGEVETRMVMLMLNKLKSDEMNIQADDLLIPLQITNSYTEKKVFVDHGMITTRFNIEIEANLNQHLFERRRELFRPKYIENLEKIANKKLEKGIQGTYQKIQREFGTDLAQSGEYLRKHDPDTWEKVKGRWDEIFPNTGIQVHADVKIRRIGDVL